jgi:hypothetical protein
VWRFFLQNPEGLTLQERGGLIFENGFSNAKKKIVLQQETLKCNSEKKHNLIKLGKIKPRVIIYNSG